MVANLRNVDEAFAADVAAGLRLEPLPPASVPARPPITDLEPSPALSIVANGPASFAGRKIGVVITDGTDRRLLDALRKAASAEGALVELIAPEIGGAVLSDGQLQPAHQRIDGGPSVLYDAVAILASPEGAVQLAAMPAAQDFVHDAHGHAKFIGYTADARPLLDAAGVPGELDEGYVDLAGRSAAATFLERCRGLRHWPRDLTTPPYRAAMADAAGG